MINIDNLLKEIENEKYPFDVPFSIDDNYRMGYNRALCVASRMIEQELIRKLPEPQVDENELREQIVKILQHQYVEYNSYSESVFTAGAILTAIRPYLRTEPKSQDDDDLEKCEGGCSEPVVTWDSEGIPLCQSCADMLRSEYLAELSPKEPRT